MSFDITNSNYEEFKRTFILIWRFQASLMNIDPEVSYSPINAIEEAENQRKSIAKKSLKIGLNDGLSMVANLPAEIKNKLNDELVNNGLQTLHALMALVKDTPSKVLKRNRIKNLDEYYLLKEIEQDVNYDLSEEDKEQIRKLLFKFESLGTSGKRGN
jgi:hypothetical protein